MATVALTPAQILEMNEAALLAAVGAELEEVESPDARFLGAVAEGPTILVPAGLPPAARTMVVRLLVARLLGVPLLLPRGVEVTG
ncbi:hypothetical protein ACWGIB_27500 [Streptomyces xiamenensis]